MRRKLWSGNLKKRDRLGDLSVDGKIRLKRILRGISSGLNWTAWDKVLVSHKSLKIINFCRNSLLIYKVSVYKVWSFTLRPFCPQDEDPLVFSLDSQGSLISDWTCSSQRSDSSCSLYGHFRRTKKSIKVTNLLLMDYRPAKEAGMEFPCAKYWSESAASSINFVKPRDS
jgi:hypothetical protein